ncbi:MAG: Na+:solute symporter [Deltaproteobacteria bacterium]|nr:Na+:solute symporter [Deltaproteobacteria bacterium]
MHPLSTLDVVIILCFAGYAVFNGLRSRKRASLDLQEYFLAGRSLPGWKAGISMAATQFAADTPLLVTGLIAVSGIFALWQLWVYAIAFLMLGFIFAAQWRRAGVLTDAELTELRYGGRAALLLRAFKAIYFGTIFNCVVLAWVLFAAARIAEPFLPWNEWLPASLFDGVVQLVSWVGVPLAAEAIPGDTMTWVRTANNLISVVVLLTVTAFYSTAGGLLSVVATDVAQFAFMMVGTFAYATVLIYEIGGFGELWHRLGELFPPGGAQGIEWRELIAFTPWHGKDATAAVVALFAVQWLIQINADGTGYLAQRSMACRSEGDARRAAVVFTFLQVLLRSLMWIVIGLSLLVMYPPEGVMTQSVREGTYVRGIAELLPSGIKGILVTAMFAAFASTVDTHLNWGSSYWTNDIFKRLICEKGLGRSPSPRTLVTVARLSNLLLVIIALVIATKLTSIHTAWQVSLLFGAGLGPVLVLRWLWWRVTAVAELAALGTSLFSAPLLLLYVPGDALRLLIAAAVSLVAVFATAAAGHKEKEATLKLFFQRVRPVGFWRPVAAMCGESTYDGHRRLASGLIATFSASLTVFSWLIAAGGVLAGGTAPSWFPGGAGLWFASVFALGLLCLPIWLPQLRGSEAPEPLSGRS